MGDHARLLEIARNLRTPWVPVPALEVNAARLRVVNFQGHFSEFHTHDEDECYVVLEGMLLVERPDAPAVELVAGDAYVVRKGTAHRPFATPKATVLLVT